MGWDFASATALGPQDVVVVSYGLLVSREDDFADRDWNGVVLDEAQSIKNETTKRAKAVKRLRSRFRLAATGTPVENRLTELWSIFDFLNPGLLGPLDSFAQRLTRDGRATEALKGLVRPFILRRLKQDVLDDLPPKTEITLSVDLGDDERTAYVILLDPWWNPVVESQAADRAHRIGQRDPVTVYHLIAADTVEERIRELHGEKRALAEDVLDGTGAAPLTPEELMGLFR